MQRVDDLARQPPGGRAQARPRDLLPLFEDDAPGAALSRQARDFWRTRWTGRSLMAIGMKDPVLGPPVMRALHGVIHGCPQPMEIADGGHFLQEWGREIATEAARVL